jgi:hypothetical protein
LVIANAGRGGEEEKSGDHEQDKGLIRSQMIDTIVQSPEMIRN